MGDSMKARLAMQSCVSQERRALKPHLSSWYGAVQVTSWPPLAACDGRADERWSEISKQPEQILDRVGDRSALVDFGFKIGGCRAERVGHHRNEAEEHEGGRPKAQESALTRGGTGGGI